MTAVTLRRTPFRFTATGLIDLSARDRQGLGNESHVKAKRGGKMGSPGPVPHPHPFIRILLWCACAEVGPSRHRPPFMRPMRKNLALMRNGIEIEK